MNYLNCRLNTSLVDIVRKIWLLTHSFILVNKVNTVEISISLAVYIKISIMDVYLSNTEEYTPKYEDSYKFSKLLILYYLTQLWIRLNEYSLSNIQIGI